MTFKIVLTSSANRDLEQTVAFITQNSSQAAAQWTQRIQTAIATLQEMPGRAAKIPEASHWGLDYRQLLVHSHRIIFRVDEAAQTVFVVRIYHAARLPLASEELA